MGALTPEEFREHQSTALGDEAVQRLIDAARAAIVARFGPSKEFTEQRRGGGSLIFLSRPADTVTTVVERFGDQLGMADTTLDASDYTVLPGGASIRREYTGVHPGDLWGDRVFVTYKPTDDDADRKRVEIALVKLDINHNPGLTSEQIADWSATYADNSAMNYSRERDEILSSLQGGLGFA